MSDLYWISACIFLLIGAITGDVGDYILAAGLFIAAEIARLK